MSSTFSLFLDGSPVLHSSRYGQSLARPPMLFMSAEYAAIQAAVIASATDRPLCEFSIMEFNDDGEMINIIPDASTVSTPPIGLGCKVRTPIRWLPDGKAERAKPYGVVTHIRAWGRKPLFMITEIMTKGGRLSVDRNKMHSFNLSQIGELKTV